MSVSPSDAGNCLQAGEPSFSTENMPNSSITSLPTVPTESLSRLEQSGVTQTRPSATDIELPDVEKCLCRFPSLAQRSSLLGKKACIKQNPLDFYADIQLTPIEISKGVHQVLCSAPGLKATEFRWKYSILRNAKSSSWSLLQMGATFESTVPLLRPIACLTTGSYCNTSESVITDLNTLWEARSFKLAHFPDSWKQGGFHVGFQADSDYRYEWQLTELPIGSGIRSLYLWRINIYDKQSISPAARIMPQSLIQDPIKPSTASRSQLWALEVDIDQISPHIAMLSAFSIKSRHNLWRSWFAPRTVVFTPPMPLINFAFQDEGRIYQRQEKFWTDDSTEMAENRNSVSVSIIPVFNKSYLEQFKIPPQVLDLLHQEAHHRKAVIEMTLAIRT